MKRGWQRWKATGIMPSRQDIDDTEEAWESDLVLMDMLDRWVNGDGTESNGTGGNNHNGHPPPEDDGQGPVPAR